MTRPWRAMGSSATWPWRVSFALALMLALSSLVGMTPGSALAAPCTVTSTADSGAGSLRDCIASVAAGETITITATGTITLTSGALAINKNLTITGPGAANLTISGNNASRIFQTTSSTVTISGLTIANGKASGSPNAGGGVRQSGGTLTLDSVIVRDSTATGGGGGVAAQGNATLIVTNSTISGNTAGISGGGLLVSFSCTATVTNSTISGNTATGGNYGGGISIGGPLTVIGSTISGNTATGGGGGIHAVDNLTLTNSTISGNTARLDGGAIFADTGSVKVRYATITGNTADSNNDDDGTGGAIYASAGAVTLSGSIVAGNLRGTTSPTANDCILDTGTIVSAGDNLVGSTTGCPTTGTGDLGLLDPISTVLNTSLANNGGTTQTHALAAGSIARDRIPTNRCNTAATDPVTTDQIGTTRPQGTTCDIGAVETAAPTPSPGAPVTLTMTITGGGTVGRNPVGTGSGPFTYPAGTEVTLVPSAASGQIFTGWKVDGTNQGWANPLTITMNNNHTVDATFKALVTFTDVTDGTSNTISIRELAARGYINGYGDGTYGPDDQTLRAQMAALIARGLGYSDSPDNPFQDRCDRFVPTNCVDAELWNRVAQLADRHIARGYDDPLFCGKTELTPCYAPRDFVLHVQVLAFVSRAMVAEGYWQEKPAISGLYGGVLVGSGHEIDVATYLFYTPNFGGVPDYPTSGPFTAWNQPATRGWFARALWAALDSYFGVDHVP